MSLKKVHDKQPDKFEFTKTNLELAEKILKKYPMGQKKSAVMPLLYLAQNQNENWIPLAAMKYIGKFLSMPYINVYEIATFYRGIQSARRKSLYRSGGTKRRIWSISNI